MHREYDIFYDLSSDMYNIFNLKFINEIYTTENSEDKINIQ